MYKWKNMDSLLCGVVLKEPEIDHYSWSNILQLQFNKITKILKEYTQ